MMVFLDILDKYIDNSYGYGLTTSTPTKLTNAMDMINAKGSLATLTFLHHNEKSVVAKNVLSILMEMMSVLLMNKEDA